MRAERGKTAEEVRERKELKGRVGCHGWRQVCGEEVGRRLAGGREGGKVLGRYMLGAHQDRNLAACREKVSRCWWRLLVLKA